MQGSRESAGNGDITMDIDVAVEPPTVQIRLGPIQRLFAVKRRLEIPLHLLVSAEAMDRKAIPAGDGTWLRAPGTHIPGLIRYGSYGRAPDREFWAVLRHRRVLVVTVHDWDYARAILGIGDPDSHAASISAAIV